MGDIFNQSHLPVMKLLFAIIPLLPAQTTEFYETTTWTASTTVTGVTTQSPLDSSLEDLLRQRSPMSDTGSLIRKNYKPVKSKSKNPDERAKSVRVLENRKKATEYSDKGEFKVSRTPPSKVSMHKWE